MECPSCKKTLPADAIFCNYCGTKVATLGPAPDQAIQASSPVEHVPIVPPPVAPSLSAGVDPGGDANVAPVATPPGGENPYVQPVSMYQPQPSAGLYGQPVAPPAQGGGSVMQPPTGPYGQPPAIYQPPTGPYDQPPPTGPYFQAPMQSGMMPTTPRPVVLPANPTRLQQWLIRTFQPNLAGNFWFGMTLGGVAAALLGIICAAIVLAVAHAISVPGNLEFSLVSDKPDLPGLVALQSPVRDTLQLLLVMHGVGQHITFTSINGTSSTSIILSSPLNGLLLFPAACLILGGYLAACTDFQHLLRASLLRGASIALPYTVLLFIFASQANGDIPYSNRFIGQTLMNTLSMDVTQLIVFGLLYGVLFGALGALLNFSGKNWRLSLHQFLYQNQRPQITGLITGGLTAIVLGLSLSLLFIFAFVVFSSYSLPIVARATCSADNNWQTLTAWSMVNGPLHAVNLLAFALGAPVNVTNQFGGGNGGFTCFYTYSQHMTISLVNNTEHLSPWVYALLLIPAFSLFMGGRVSAALTKVQVLGPAAIQGALIAIPFTILMIFLTSISTVTHTYTSIGIPSGGGNYVLSAGVGAADLLLWSLLWGAVFGGLGGLYQISSIKTPITEILTFVAKPFTLLFTPFFVLLDMLAAQPRSSRSTATQLLYSALVSAVLIALLAAVVGGVSISMNQVISMELNQRIRDWASVLLVAIPGLLLIGAAASALRHPPAVQDPYQPSPVTPIVSTQGGL